MGLIRIGEPGPSFGQLGHPFGRGLAPYGVEQSLIEGAQEFFDSGHGPMLARSAEENALNPGVDPEPRSRSEVQV